MKPKCTHQAAWGVGAGGVVLGKNAHYRCLWCPRCGAMLFSNRADRSGLRSDWTSPNRHGPVKVNWFSDCKVLVIGSRKAFELWRDRKSNLIEWTKQIGLSTDFPDDVIVTNSAVTILGLARGKNDGLLVLNDARPGCLKVAQIKGWHVR